MNAMTADGGRKRVPVLGSGIDAVTLEEALDRVAGWAQRRESRYVTLCNVHVVVTARTDPAFGQALRDCDLALPDGMPVAWTMRRKGAQGQKRLGGPDFMLSCCARAEALGIPVYFYGSTQQTLDALAARLHADYPALRFGGVYSPPFRPQTEAELDADIKAINDSGAGYVFIGLGCPKQELWMRKNRERIHAVLLGVGAGFDFAAGLKARAPLWMQRTGLEWLHRLSQEPGRLWRRYAVTNSLFVYHSLRELLRLG